MDISISELHMVSEKIFAHLLELGIETVSLPHDFYWSIPKEELYDPYSQPNQLTLGQLSDDLVELKKISNEESLPLSYALVWLAAIIRAIGEETIS